MTVIDLNCDLGEGQGDDAAILPFVTSANVACGLHAGDASAMRRTVDEAARLGVAVGAHPGFADRERFGRVELDMPPDEIRDLVAYQIGALEPFLRRAGTRLQHVKAHGALYHLAGRRAEIAEALARATREAGDGLVLMGAPGSAMEGAAAAFHLRFAAEGFADRSYADDGTLLPRSHPQAMVDGGDEVVAARALEIVRTGQVPTHSGRRLSIAIHSLCLHGDDPRAAGRARAIREALERGGVRVESLGKWLA
jgi:UPF0271 protein